MLGTLNAELCPAGDWRPSPPWPSRVCSWHKTFQRALKTSFTAVVSWEVETTAVLFGLGFEEEV